MRLAYLAAFMCPTVKAPLSTVPGPTDCKDCTDGRERLTEFRDRLFREGSLRDLTIDGRRYCLADVGQGPALVLLHGLGGSLYDWRHLIHPLSLRYRVIAPDLLGSGESDCPGREDYSLAAQARRVKALLGELGVTQGSFVGNSYGGGIALRLAQDWPERVDRLVLINSVCYPENIPFYAKLAKAPGAGRLAEQFPMGTLIRGLLRRCYPTVRNLSERELDVYVRELSGKGRRSVLVQVLRDLQAPDTTEFVARLKAIRAPALLLWGTSDRTIPATLGRRLSQELPDARWVELDAGHVPNQEIPQEVLRRILDFIDPLASCK
jgi:pimeloyl-ACP methyl ester carboxylesterase